MLEAANGIEALSILGQKAADAVISDILMPGMDGFRLCHEIRKSAKFGPCLPVVLYTATYGTASDRELAETVGADGYLLKPAPTAAILAAVRKAQRAVRLRREAAPDNIDDQYVLEKYNAALVRKLEHRNAELRESLSGLQAAHEHIVELNQNLQARVEQRTAALEASNKELEAFAFGAAHELNSPLAGIDGYARLLDETLGSSVSRESRECLDQIIGGVRRMRDLIDALLEFARTSRVEPHVTTVDTEMLVEEVLAAAARETLGRNIQWRRTRLPNVRADRTLLRQVFANLISNAIKYTRTRDPAVIEIGTRSGRAAEVVVFVRDNGVGFDPLSAGRLFGAFHRMHRADRFEGSGIGLANVHRIISRHGGKVWADAAVGRGATFCFSLPSAPPS